MRREPRRIQRKLFGGSEVRGPSAPPAVQPSLQFGEMGWIEAAQDWARVHGLTITALKVDRTFRVGCRWVRADWSDGAAVWEFTNVG